MKKTTLLIVALSWMATLSAQKQVFDLATYTAPGGWKKQAGDKSVQFTREDKTKGTFCIITLFKSVPGTGISKSDFDAAWESIVKEMVTVTALPSMQDTATENGWVAQSGFSPFEADGTSGIALLVTMSGFQKMINILILTNTDAYQEKVSGFLESITLKKPAPVKIIPVKPETVNPDKTHTPVTVAGSSGYKFTTTNFDDGWVSNIKEDWVEVIKGNFKVLLHYPNAKAEGVNSDVNVMCAAAWNTLVAPRYSNIENYEITPGVLDYLRPYYAQANLTENATGKRVFVSLFRKGQTGWIEIISPDKQSFLQTFGPDISKIDYYADNKIWDKLVVLKNYNKFAVAPTDFSGKWNDHFASNTYYTNAITGMSAGMSTYSSSQWFEFGSKQNYRWQLVMANSYGGASSFASAKGDGTFKVINNWQMHFSELEGKPKLFDVYFTATKGGRILWMNDAKYPGSGIFTGFAKEK